jgi:hypothetical protein
MPRYFADENFNNDIVRGLPPFATLIWRCFTVTRHALFLPSGATLRAG